MENLTLSPSKQQSVLKTMKAVQESLTLIYTRYNALGIDGTENEQLLKEIWLRLADQGAPIKYLGTIPGVTREGVVISFTGFSLRISTSAGTIKLYIPVGETEKFEAVYKVGDHITNTLKTNGKFKIDRRNGSYQLSFTRLELEQLSILMQEASLETKNGLSVKLHKLALNFENIVNVVPETKKEENNWF